jgi:hypothetical protein
MITIGHRMTSSATGVLGETSAGHATPTVFLR